MFVKMLSVKNLDPLYSNVIRFRNNNERLDFFKKHCDFDIEEFVENSFNNLSSTSMQFQPINDTSILITCPIEDLGGAYYGDDGLVDDAINTLNYCVVIIADDIETWYPKFYFIKEIEIQNGKLATFLLELDIFTTHLDILNNGFDEVLVNRKHCRRFDENGDLRWEDAVLGDSLDVNFNAQVIKKVESCVINYFKGTPPFDFVDRYGNLGLNEEDLKELNENMGKCGWLYFFFSDKPSELFDEINIVNIDRCKIGNINTGMYVIALPLDATINTFYPNANNDGTIIFNQDIVRASIYNIFLNSTTLLSVKFSRFAPFISVDDYSLVDENGYPFIIKYLNNYFFNGIYTIGNLQITGLKNHTDASCIVVNRMNNELYESLEILNDIPKNISTSNNNAINYNYEPKLWCSPYFKLGLKSNDSQEYFYNPLILKENYKVILNRTISPVNEKIYATLISDVETIYSKFNENNVGLFNTSSNDLATISNVYKDWWARNSSAMITGLTIPLINDTTHSVVRGISKGGITGIISGVADGMHTGIGILNDFVGNQINLSNTPDSIKNQGNNGYFEYSRMNNNKSYQLVITQYELFEKEKKQVYDYYYRFGYQVNRIEYWDNLFERSRFNYIKLADEQLVSKIKLNLSNNLKLIIANILNSGLTIWEYDTWHDYGFNLTNENVEK